MGHKWDRETKRPPTLAEQRVDAPETPRHRSKKDTKRWCRGKVGRDHAPGIRLGQAGQWAVHRGEAPCGWLAPDDWRYTLVFGRNTDGKQRLWSCYHEDCCTACGKTLSYSLRGVGERCPDYPAPN